MSKGYILKVLENVDSPEMSDQIEAAKDMLQHGYDANDDQWQALNSKVEKSEKDRAKQGQQADTGRDAGSNVVQGTKGHQQYVSGAEPGEVGNQIGWPGTEQDQDGPGQKNRTVPGVKPPTKHDKK